MNHKHQYNKRNDKRTCSRPNINEKVGIEVTSIKGKVNAKTKKLTQLSRFNEEKRMKKMFLLPIHLMNYPFTRELIKNT